MARSTGYSDENYLTILDKLENRLNQIGPITITDAWAINNEYNYNILSKVFRNIMGCMVEMGKAKKIKNGQYHILKPNTPTKKAKTTRKEIKLDPVSLPMDGRMVRFYHLKTKTWIEGYFLKDAQLFIHGFEDSGDFSDPFVEVSEWEYLQTC